MTAIELLKSISDNPEDSAYWLGTINHYLRNPHLLERPTHPVSANQPDGGKDEQECMAIDTKPGAKVIYAFPNNGMSGDRDLLEKRGLVVGSEYTVEEVRAGGFSSAVMLKEYPGCLFNTVNFAASPSAPIAEGDK